MDAIEKFIIKSEQSLKANAANQILDFSTNQNEVALWPILIINLV